MTRVRSPAALVASLACLASAAVLASALVAQAPDTPDLASAHEGDSVEVRGELEPWTQDGWERVHNTLWGTTYQVEMPDVEDVVLLTGMASGLEHQTLIATAIVLLQVDHPDEPVQIIVLAPSEAPGMR